jgi:hypothetical protein
MLGVVAAVEGGDAGGAEVQAFCKLSRQHRGAQVGMLGQQPEGYHKVRLAAAHRLGQLEGGLVGASRKPQQALAKEGVQGPPDRLPTTSTTIPSK